MSYCLLLAIHPLQPRAITENEQFNGIVKYWKGMKTAFGKYKKSDRVRKDAEEKIDEHLSEMKYIKGKIPAGECFGTVVCVYHWLIQTR